MISLSTSKEVILNTVGENIKISLDSHTINDGNKWFKRALRQVDSRPKGVHVELDTDYTE